MGPHFAPCVLCVLCVLGAAAPAPLAFADEPPAAKDPTAPQTPAKPLTPKDVFPKVFDAMIQGDLPALRSRLHLADEQARKVGGWFEDVAKGAAEARKATLARFGEGAEKELAAAGNALSREELAGVSEEIDGETATVWLGDREVNDPIPMRKVEGTWRVDIALMVRQEEWSADKIAKETTSSVERLKRLRDRIEKGEVATAEAAARAIRSAVQNSEDNAEEQKGL